ncbi:MAG: YicC/YloC family endoribonuclease [Candidatus Firestonebacteria bacterium]
MISMTGYGRAQVREDNIQVVVESKSINHKFLEIAVKIPSKFISYESKIKKLVQDKITRGRVEIFLNSAENRKDSDVIVNNKLAYKYLEAFKSLQKQLNIHGEITLDMFLNIPEVLLSVERKYNIESYWKIVKHTVEESLLKLIDMKKKEGAVLYQDISKRIESIRKLVNNISLKAPDIINGHKKRLEAKVKEILKTGDTSVKSEIMNLIQRYDFTEELVRLNAHLKYFRQTIDKEKIIGKKLDFILQEINREANTIASKVNNLEISQYVVTIKTELEKVREQVQNIE